jgi:hypothetical protein
VAEIYFLNKTFAMVIIYSGKELNQAVQGNQRKTT